MKRYGLFYIFVLLWSTSLSAKCFLGDAYVEKGRMEQAKEAYLMCSQTGDNVDANYALGKIYREGTAGQKDLYRSLFYFRFAAENGSAAAQRELAKTMFMLKKQGQEGLDILDRYEETMGHMKSEQGQSSEPIYAYTWLLLAAEKADNKWYYSAPAQQDLEAVRLYNSMNTQLTKDEQQQVLAQASAFKEEKLDWAAKVVLSPDEYSRFRSILYPVTGDVNLALRSTEMTKLKEKVMRYLHPEHQEKSRSSEKEQKQDADEKVPLVEVTGRLGFSN